MSNRRRCVALTLALCLLTAPAFAEEAESAEPAMAPVREEGAAPPPEDRAESTWSSRFPGVIEPSEHVPERAIDYLAIGADALVVRPFSLAAVGVGAPFFLVAAPFSYMSGQLPQTYEVFLGSPLGYAWWRDLGDL